MVGISLFCHRFHLEASMHFSVHEQIQPVRLTGDVFSNIIWYSGHLTK